MGSDVNRPPNTFELALIPTFSRQNGRRGKNVCLFNQRYFTTKFIIRPGT